MIVHYESEMFISKTKHKGTFLTSWTSIEGKESWNLLCKEAKLKEV